MYSFMIYIVLHIFLYLFLNTIILGFFFPVGNYLFVVKKYAFSWNKLFCCHLGRRIFSCNFVDKKHLTSKTVQ